jgi:glycosyltransferase involved in cell wall biosynthesis
MTPIPILFVMDELHDADRGGTERQFNHLLAHLDRRRIAPQLAVFRSASGAAAPALTACPVRSLSITKIARASTLVRLVALSRVIRASGIRVAHVFFNDASIVAPFFCRLGGARVIVSRRDMGFWYTPRLLRVLRISNRFVSRIVVNSAAVRDNVHRFERFPLSRTDVLPNGLNLQGCEAPPLSGFLERHGIDPGDPVIGMVAHFHPWKRQRDLALAFREVLRRHPSAHLVFVGSGACEADVRAACNGELHGRVHFAGAVANPIPLVRHFTVGVLCSDSEGLSNAVLEYQACGIPVVCTNVGGNVELVTDGGNGFLIAPGDVAALADRLCRLLDDRGLRAAMGARGRAVAAGHSVAAMADAHMALYESLDALGAR